MRSLGITVAACDGPTGKRSNHLAVEHSGHGTGIGPFHGMPCVTYPNRNRTVQVLNNTSIVTGSHSLRFGGEYRRDHYNQIGSHQPTGWFNFLGRATLDPSDDLSRGEGFADFLLGAVRRATRVTRLYDAKLRATSVAFYLQDTWRVTPRLTLDLGIRYEYTPPYHDARRGIINAQVFDMGAGPGGLNPDTRTPVLTRPGEGDFYDELNFRYDDSIPTQAGDQFMSRRLVADDRNDWAPRVGIAFSPSKRWTVRAGVGVFYSQDIGHPTFEMSRNLSGTDSFGADRQKPNSDLSDPWASSAATAECTGWDGVCLQKPELYNIISGRRTPYVSQWMFDIQRQLTNSIMVQAGYHGNGGHKLQRTRAFNQPVNRSGPDDPSSEDSRQPWPEYDILREVDSVANSNYHALNLKLEGRLSHGATFLVGYTWSKAIDDGSAAYGSRLGDFPLDNYNLQAERGLSQFHVGQRLAASFVYELPIGPGRAISTRGGLVGKILEGWQLNSILSVSEGSPTHVSSIGDTNDTGVTNYPDATGISPVVDDPTPERYWNVEAFDTRNPELQYREGNVGPSNLISPGLVNWDLSLLKDIVFSESHRLQLRFEVYNAANHPNWWYVDNDARSNSFGQVFNTRQMRTIQLGVKYLF